MVFTQQASSEILVTGTVVSMTAPPAAGDAVKPGCFLLITNASGSSINVTLTVGRTYQGLTITPPVVAVAAGTTKAIGPIPADPYAQLSGVDQDWVEVTYSAVASVTRAVLTIK